MIFSNIMKDVVVLGTEEEATVFLHTSNAMSEFRRLRKWLHQPARCKECAELLGPKGQLSRQCRQTDAETGLPDPAGQNFLRNLNFEEHACNVLAMRLKIPEFHELVVQTLMLVEKFCWQNPVNQELMARHMNIIFIPLLSGPPRAVKRH